MAKNERRRKIEHLTVETFKDKVFNFDENKDLKFEEILCFIWKKAILQQTYKNSNMKHSKDLFEAIWLISQNNTIKEANGYESRYSNNNFKIR
jgi:hypothetical protein